jgi:hypothetical protein
MRTPLAPEIAERVHSLVSCAARQADVQAAVEANHDENRWWPLSVADWRVRMTVAGWSSRISYSMISTYADVVTRANSLGWSALTTLNDADLAAIVRPLGLVSSRISYLRSLSSFLSHADTTGINLTALHADDLINLFTASVRGAGYKIAQCATLYARGYHCGVIPVDSGMVTKLAPFLGVQLRSGPDAHEQFRHMLQDAASTTPGRYRDLAAQLRYRVRIPEDADPTWFIHLILIYFKRLYLNRPGPRLCPRRPSCADFLDCGCGAGS